MNLKSPYQRSVNSHLTKTPLITMSDYASVEDFMEKAIISGDVDLVRINVVCSPKLIDVINNLSPSEFFEECSFEMINLLIEYGVRLTQANDIYSVINRFGLENARPILAHRDDVIDRSDELMEMLYTHSVEALEWLRDSGIPNVFTSRTDIGEIGYKPDVDKVAVFFSTPSNALDGERCWRTIYQDFPLGDLINLTGNLCFGGDHSKIQSAEWKAKVDGIVDLFFRNMKTPEEYKIMQAFAEKNPEYELPERSLDPSFD